MQRASIPRLAWPVLLFVACQGPEPSPLPNGGARDPSPSTSERATEKPRPPRPRPAPASYQRNIDSAASLLDRNDPRHALNYLRDAIERLQEEESQLEPATRLARWREVGGLASRARGTEEEVRARQRIHDLLREAPAGELELLAAKVDLACARAEDTDHSQARVLLEEVLGTASTLTPETPEQVWLVLRSRHALACVLLALGDPAAASPEIETVLAARLQTLSVADPLLLRTKLDAAQIRRANGDLEGARVLLEQVLAEGEVALDRAESTVVRVELAETSAALGSTERIREIFGELSSDELDLERLPGGNGLLRRVVSVGARLLDLEELERTLQDSPGLDPDLQAAESALLLEARRQRVMASFARLRPRDTQRSAASSVVESIPGVPIPIPGLPSFPEALPSIPGARELQQISQSALPYAPGIAQPLGNAPVWLRGLAGSELGEKIGSSLNAAYALRQANDLFGALTEERKQVSLLEQNLPQDDPRVFEARLQFAQNAWGFQGTQETLRSLDELLERSEATRSPDDPKLVEAKWQLALTKRELGELEGAGELLHEVLAARGRLLDRLHPELHEALAALAWNELELGRTFEARELVNRLLERMKERVRDAGCLAPREAREAARVELSRLSEAFSLVDALDSAGAFERDTFVLLESLRLISNARPPSLASSPEIAARRREAGRLRAELADLCQVGPDEKSSIPEWSARVRELEAQLDALGKEILAAEPEFASLLAKVQTQALGSVLPERAAFVGFWRHVRTFPGAPGDAARPQPESHFSAFVVRAGGAFQRVDLGPSAPLEDLVRSYRGALILGRTTRGQPVVELRDASLEGAAEGLRARLLDPLLATLEGAQELHVCLDDVLHLIPIGALALEDGQYLGERFAVHHELSLARLLAPEAPAPEGSASLALCGGIDYDAEPAEREVELVTAPLGERSAEGPGLEPLPGSEREVTALAALFEAGPGGDIRILTGPAATKSALRTSVAGARYVHLATHGWFAPESLPSRGDEVPPGVRSVVRGFAPMVLCGLALSGANRGRDELGRVPGILTAEELAGFDLASAELVVLSACETSLGLRRAGQGVQSLQSALFAAGARSALTSLWKVSDEATATFMETFYRALWHEGASKHEALRRAQRELRESGHPPSDWAAWVLCGDTH